MRKKWICFLTACIMVLSIGCARTAPTESSATRSSAPGTTSTSPASAETSSVKSVSSAVVTDTPMTSPAVIASKDFRFLHSTIGYHYLDGRNGKDLVYYGSYPLIALTADDAEKYTSISNSLKSYSDALDFEMKSKKDSLMPEAIEASSDKNYRMYSYEVAVEFKRTDSLAFSFLEKREDDTGGDYDTEYIGRNYNTQTGGEMKLTDIIPNISSLPEFLAGKLLEKYPDISFTDLQKNIGDLCLTPDGSGLSWTFGYYDLTFYFSPSTIAPDASGLLTVTVPFLQKPELFNPVYTAVPENYVVALTQGETKYIYPEDGSTAVEIKAENAYVSDVTYGKRTITLGAEVFNFDEKISDYPFAPYFVHLSDGRNYLYLSFWEDDDYQSVEVYQIDGGRVSYVGNLDNAGVGDEGFIDPESFYLSSCLDILSTYSGERRYHIGSDGLPVPNEDEYRLFDDRQLTSKADVVCDILNDQYQVSEKDVRLPSGTVFTISRTDGKTIADAVLSDGRICRIYVEKGDGWAQTVNGQDIKELFDGLIFAG